MYHLITGKVKISLLVTMQRLPAYKSGVRMSNNDWELTDAFMGLDDDRGRGHFVHPKSQAWVIVVVAVFAQNVQQQQHFLEQRW